MPARSTFLPRAFLLFAALLPASCVSSARPPVETAPSPDAVALTFGRCDGEACPRPADPKAAGDAELQSVLRKCLGEELGRPVYMLGDAPIPPGNWLDVSVRPRADTQDGRTMIDFRLLREARKEAVAGFRYVLPANAASYREVCQKFSEYVRPRLQ